MVYWNIPLLPKLKYCLLAAYVQPTKKLQIQKMFFSSSNFFSDNRQKWPDNICWRHCVSSRWCSQFTMETCHWKDGLIQSANIWTQNGLNKLCKCKTILSRSVSILNLNKQIQRINISRRLLFTFEYKLHN